MKEKESIIKELSTLISFATISSDESRRPAIVNCARWLQQHFYSIGMQKAEVYSTSSHPVVYAEHITHPSRKTILFYGHYDVQPIDPVEKWNTPPFKAVVKGNFICGRGASDDKGQMFIHIKAVEKLLGNKALPVNIKFLIEGAEEIGSAGLRDFIASHNKLLSCDATVVSDTKMMSLNEPAITYSLRGSLNAEVTIQTAKKDLHSGTFGGCVPNAAIALSDFISRLHCNDYSIAIPGFYDDVEKIPIQERRFIQASGITDDIVNRDAEAFFAWGEKNYTMHERSTIRPSLSVTGVTSGFQGPGVKNVIPSVASAKINFRLVPQQNPNRIRFLLDNYIRKILPANTRVKTDYSSFANPVRVSKDNFYVKTAARAYESVFQRKVKFLQNGGTIAAVDHLHSILNTPVVLMGFAQAGDNMHAPNEKFYLPNFFRGIDTVALFLEYIGLLKNKKYSNASVNY